MPSEKARWRKPTVTVLAHGTPEEHVLGTCKHSTWIVHVPPDVRHLNCEGYITLPCVLCSLLASS